MERMTKEKVFCSQFLGLIRWSIIRHKNLFIVFSLTQIFLSLGVVFGISLMTEPKTKIDAVYLASGAMTLGVIAVGCVLSAQIINTAKIEGVIKYQRTLPVRRSLILISDLFIWSIASLPGVFMSHFASHLRFRFGAEINLKSIFIILLIQICMISIGFCIAYLFTPNVVGLVSQIIMIGGLLFSPILFPADRLPAWIGNVYEKLPFVPASQLIRSQLFNQGAFLSENLLVIIIWGLIGVSFSLYVLEKRN